jgi:hypothetical protein
MSKQQRLSSLMFLSQHCFQPRLFAGKAVASSPSHITITYILEAERGKAD